MSPGEKGRYGKKLLRLSLAGSKDQCGAVNVFRRRKKKGTGGKDTGGPEGGRRSKEGAA